MAENSGELATPQSPVPPEQEPLIDALLAVVEQLHRPLDEGERVRVRTMIALGRQTSAALMAYPLSNADEPDPIFSAFRGD